MNSLITLCNKRDTFRMTANTDSVDLNFKVPRIFRTEFKVLAARLGLNGRELLFHAYRLAKAEATKGKRNRP
ncbi:hypothetical protein [Insolitispirillum peregrinum]|uniref:hypothetical protein n=1 Tax=Insolitispirillum peregrinum TaxID=80876 RepID=UPI00360BE65A